MFNISAVGASEVRSYLPQTSKFENLKGGF
jgi:hypothetical protein